MSDSGSQLYGHIRAYLGTEAAAGFPRLKRIPHTGIVQLLDYYNDQTSIEQGALLDALATYAATGIRRDQPGRAALLEGNQAWRRFDHARKAGEYWGGYRYTDVKMLRMIAGDKESGGIDLLLERSPARSRTPRLDLLPSPDCLVSAKAPAIRRGAEDGLAKLFAPKKVKMRHGSIRYVGTLEGNELSVSLDTGSRAGQLCYGVSVLTAAYPVKLFQMTYESLWGAELGWNYLTEENLPRAMALFPEQVAEVSRLATRLNAASSGA